MPTARRRSGSPCPCRCPGLYVQAVVIRGVGGGESIVSNRVSALVVGRLGTPRLPAVSCLEILDAGASLGDGDYWLDPEGDGSAFLATCDMTTDGGGWTMFHHITTPIPGFVHDDYLAMSTYQDGVLAAGNRLGCKPDDTTAMLRISGPGVQPWSIAARQLGPTDGGCPTTDATYFSVTDMVVPVKEINATLDTSNWALGIHSTSDAYGTEPDVCMTSDLDCRSLLQVWGGRVAYVDARRAVVTGQTVRKELQALKRGLTEARKRGHSVPRFDAWPEVTTSPPKASQAGQLHDAAVLRRWLAELAEPSCRMAARRRNPLAPLQAGFVLRTGLRAEEARRVRMSWVEVAATDSPVPAFLRIPRQASKTKRERVVALTEDAAGLLLQASEHTPQGEPLFPGNYRKAFDGAARRIGYAGTVTLRDLRHCYATFGSMGGDLVAVQSALGHTDLRTTSRYVHGTSARTAVASLSVEREIAGPGGGDPKAGTPSTGSASVSAGNRVSTEEKRGRGGRIRTCDPLLPKQVRYQAALHPD
jgi:integrase